MMFLFARERIQEDVTILWFKINATNNSQCNFKVNATSSSQCN